VPADAGIDDVGAGLLDGLRHGHHLVPGAAALDQVEHRQAEDDDELGADAGAHGADHFEAEAHAVFQAAAPAVVAVVGVRHEELVDQVALGAHDLDTVVVGELAHRRALRVVGDGFLDFLFRQRMRRRRIDRRLERRGRHRAFGVGVAPGMQDLHADLAAVLVHGVGDDAVFGGFRLVVEDRCALHHDAVGIRREAAGDDEADAALRPRRVEGRHASVAVADVLQAGMHRSHQDAVLQRGEAEVERRQQVRVGIAHGKELRVAG
jgi:hypothetical protein